MIQYRALLEAELSPSLFDAFVRRQVVSQCWRKRGGVWRIEYDPFVDDWNKADYQALLQALSAPWRARAPYTVHLMGICSRALSPSKVPSWAVEHNIWTYPISMYRKSCAAAASAHGCFPLPSSLHAAMRLKSCIFPPIPLWKAKPFTVLWAA